MLSFGESKQFEIYNDRRFIWEWRGGDEKVRR